MLFFCWPNSLLNMSKKRIDLYKRNFYFNQYISEQKETHTQTLNAFKLLAFILKKGLELMQVIQNCDHILKNTYIQRGKDTWLVLIWLIVLHNTVVSIILHIVQSLTFLKPQTIKCLIHWCIVTSKSMHVKGLT